MRIARRHGTLLESGRWPVLLLLLVVAAQIVAPGLHSLSHALPAGCSAGGHSGGGECEAATDAAPLLATVPADEHDEDGACSLCWFLQHTRWLPGHLPPAIQALPRQAIGKVSVPECRLEVHLGRGQALARGPPHEAMTHTA
jgi:hypothetical protein